jgi:hypothetical protein
MNLLIETNEALEEHGKDMSDVIWIGCEEYLIPLQLWPILADREYNDSCGYQIVDDTLKVVGDSWWLERCEYDGSEWWEFKELPDKPEETTWIPDIFLGM